MAAALAAQIFSKAEIVSAGVNAWGNQPASRHAITVMEEDGLCLLKHRATLVSDEIIKSAKLVLTMTETHKMILLSDYPGEKTKIFNLGEYAGENVDISDPFGGSLEEYRACAAQIKALLVKAARRLEAEI